MNKYLKEILDEMGRRVGAKDIDPKVEGWYLKHTWTSEQQDEFHKWLTNYLNSNEVQKALYDIPDKENSREQAWFFIMTYGWIVEEK